MAIAAIDIGYFRGHSTGRLGTERLPLGAVWPVALSHAVLGVIAILSGVI